LATFWAIFYTKASGHPEVTKCVFELVFQLREKTLFAYLSSLFALLMVFGSNIRRV
jgi:hypothetical protein